MGEQLLVVVGGVGPFFFEKTGWIVTGHSPPVRLKVQPFPKMTIAQQACSCFEMFSLGKGYDGLREWVAWKVQP